MPVIYELTSLPARGRETGAVHDVIKTTLQHEQQVLAVNALVTACCLEIIAELFLQDEVDTLNLLLLAQLLTVALDHLATSRAVLSRRIGAALFDSTGRLVAAVTFAAAQTAHRFSISSHSLFSASAQVGRKSLQAVALLPFDMLGSSIEDPNL